MQTNSKPVTPGKMAAKYVTGVDVDDIFRQIDYDSVEDCEAECLRLWTKKRVGYRSWFTQYYNSLISLMTSATNGDHPDTSSSTRETLERLKVKLENAYDKLQTCMNRALLINPYADDDKNKYTKAFNDEIANQNERYIMAIKSFSDTMKQLSPRHQPREQNLETNTVKPIQDLKPNFTLGFDNSPTELNAWIAQFKAYFDASKLSTLQIYEQQSFLRQALHPELWTAISQYINVHTTVFDTDDDFGEVSCISAIKDAFQVRYPKIMRRYRFFTYQRRGTQTFTSFYSQLKELALAAELENMTQNDYLIFRIIIGINDPATVDKLLAIPQENFNLEEIHRVATALEAAKNYSSFKNNSNNGNSSNYVSQKKPSNKPPPSKIDQLKAKGLCFRCGKKLHSKGEQCPHKTSKCHNCGILGHISPVCNSASKTNTKPRQNTARQTNKTNLTFATSCFFQPTPRQEMSFQNYK